MFHRTASLQSRLLSGVIAITFCVSSADGAEIGSPGYAWKYLQGTDGQLHSLADYNQSKFVVVAFLCNKCPCVKGYENRFKKFSAKFGVQGVKFVGINSSIGPVENMGVMKQRALAGKYNFDYLRDANQTTGRGFRATSTPHVFILDQNRNVVYSGAFDDNRSESSVRSHYVVDAVTALLAGKSVPVATTKQFGCAISYAR